MDTSYSCAAVPEETKKHEILLLKLQKFVQDTHNKASWEPEELIDDTPGLHAIEYSDILLDCSVRLLHRATSNYLYVSTV